MLETMLHTIKDRVRNTIRRECGDTCRQRFDASDVAQESLIQIWTKMDEVEIERLISCNNWLRKIALGHRARLKRKQLAKKRSPFNEAALHEYLPSDSSCGAEKVQLREQIDLIMRELAELDSLDHQIVTRYIFEDESFLAIAFNINRSDQFVRRRYQRAIRRMSQRLKDKGVGIED